MVTRLFADKPIRGQDDSRTGRFADRKYSTAVIEAYSAHY